MTKNNHSAEVRNTYAQMGLSSLAIRFAMGFIFWGGFSRRAIYAVAPADGNHFKLDIDHANLVGNKIAAAYPGSFMPETLVSVIQNVPLMNFTMWLFSFAELAVGLALIFGFATRADACAAKATARWHLKDLEKTRRRRPTTYLAVRCRLHLRPR